MSCTNCSAHWCWKCGLEFSIKKIYNHMNEAHGGIGFDDFINSD